MRSLSASELLNSWDSGMAQPSAQWALSLISTSIPNVSIDRLARLSVGQRDNFILLMREMIFGPELAGLIICPQCGENLELTFKAEDIRATPEAEPEDEMEIRTANYSVFFRLPNSLDLMAISDCKDVEKARWLLLERCILRAYHKGDDHPIEDLPDSIVKKIEKRMLQVDPQADVLISVVCPECDHKWNATFDICSFFYREIDSWAYRVLKEVHILASVHGWSESDILAMSSRRRRAYLEMTDS
jgi:hypothetical protein